MTSESTTGEKALRYFTSMRIELTKSSLIRNKENTPIGHMIKIRTTKNKLSLPYQDTLLEFDFGKGVSKISDMIQIGIHKKGISKSGAYFYFNEKAYPGKDNLLKAISEDK